VYITAGSKFIASWILGVSVGVCILSLRSAV
jgi:hypothetical protein